MDYKTLYEQTKTLSVLLVEDYEPLRREMLEVLEDLFKTVLVASNGEEALALYKDAFHDNHSEIDLIISDIQMPNMDGVDLTRNIRNLHEEQAIIILSAHTDKQYLLELINMGISKFITKPLEYNSFLHLLEQESKRIHLSKPKIKNEMIVELGMGYTWDNNSFILSKDGEEIKLTKHEILLLQALISKSNSICTTEYILDNFYTNGVHMNEKNIRNLIFKLRKKLKTNSLESIYGLGYKLIH